MGEKSSARHLHHPGHPKIWALEFIGFGMAWYHLVWLHLAWIGLVYFGLVRIGIIRFGLV